MGFFQTERYIVMNTRARYCAALLMLRYLLFVTSTLLTWHIHDSRGHRGESGARETRGLNKTVQDGLQLGVLVDLEHRLMEVGLGGYLLQLG